MRVHNTSTQIAEKGDKIFYFKDGNPIEIGEVTYFGQHCSNCDKRAITGGYGHDISLDLLTWNASIGGWVVDTDWYEV